MEGELGAARRFTEPLDCRRMVGVTPLRLAASPEPQAREPQPRRR
jgi:hypothetical protein